MERGKIITHPEEAQAVKEIFGAYLAGETYQKIADRLTITGPRYHSHTQVWNKHMVKRILENETYLGKGKYPQLVEQKQMLDVRLLRSGRTVSTPCPAEVQPIRRKALCARCGAKMARDTKTHGKPHWVCANEDCKQVFYMDDEVLLDLVGTQLREKFCKQSPSLRETDLHDAVLAAMNRMFEGQAARKVLQESVATVIAGKEQAQSLPAIESKIRSLQERQMELYQLALAEGPDCMDYDEELQQVNAEKTALLAQKAELEQQGRPAVEFDRRMDEIGAAIETADHAITEFDSVTVRQLISCVKVVDKDRILVRFKDGSEVEQEVIRK